MKTKIILFTWNLYTAFSANCSYLTVAEKAMGLEDVVRLGRIPPPLGRAVEEKESRDLAQENEGHEQRSEHRLERGHVEDAFVIAGEKRDVQERDVAKCPHDCAAVRPGDCEGCDLKVVKE
jgi:hypothetical protein